MAPTAIPTTLAGTDRAARKGRLGGDAASWVCLRRMAPKPSMVVRMRLVKTRRVWGGLGGRARSGAAVCLVLVVAGLGSARQAAAVEYELHGYAWSEISGRPRDVSPAGPRDFSSGMTAEPFSVYVRDEAWLIRTVVGAGSSGWRPTFILEVGSTNGQEVIRVGWSMISPPPWVLRSNAPPTFGSRRVPPLHPWPPSSAIMCSNSVPPLLEADWFSSHLWLMFASGCYLLRQSTRELIPIYERHLGPISKPPAHLGPISQPPASGVLDRRPRPVRADWQLSPQEPHLPLYVACGPAFYGVTGTTNVEGLVLPTGFSFRRFDSSPGGVVLQPYLCAVVTNASARCSRASLLPPLPVDRIWDWRLQDAEPQLGHVSYAARHLRRWPTVAESKRVYLAWQRKQEQEARRKEREQQRAKPWQLAGFALLLVAPVAWAWLHSRRPKPRH